MYVTWVWGPVIPAIRKLRKEDLEFKASLSYTMSSTQPGLHSENLSQQNEKEKREHWSSAS
jgi:hypothetical protein